MSTKKYYHKNVIFNVCGKVMRDDHLKNHISSKHVDTLELKRPIEIHRLQCNDPNDDCKEHNRNLEIYEEKLFEESLTKQHKFCLELFQGQQPSTDVAGAVFTNGKNQLLDVIEHEK